jgi:peptidyl-tRNA hydrolase
MKMYVIVRDDISKSYQAAQGGHALAQMASGLWPPKVFEDWNNGTIVYLKASP